MAERSAEGGPGPPLSRVGGWPATAVGRHDICHTGVRTATPAWRTRPGHAGRYDDDNASDLIVLDEPTTGTDVSARQAFWATMREQADQGRTILVATRYLEEADAIADRILVLHRGWLLANGTAAEIKAKARARRISFDLLDGAIDAVLLRNLPFLTSVTVSNSGSAAGSGQTVRTQSSDADATVHALYGLGLCYPRNLEVAGLGLEQAFVAIIEAGEACTS